MNNRELAVGMVQWMREVQISPGVLCTARMEALAKVLRGIVDVITGECTIEGGIVEDVCRMIERCQDREELRDLSVQVRDLNFRFEPDAGRVAMTEDEARVLRLLERV